MENISENKKKFQTGKMKVPAFLFSAKNTFSGDDTLEKVEKIGENENIFHHIAILSDAHSKLNIKNPTGSVVASENILPEMLDAAPNCGMRVVLTDLNDIEMTAENIKKLFDNLKKNIPSKKIIGTKISGEMVSDIFRHGSMALKEKFTIRTKNEFENTYHHGNFFGDKKISKEEISGAIPKIISWIAKFRLGLLGATSSHFIHLMRVSSVEDENSAKILRVRNGQYLFFMHTGSSIVGRYAASLYTPRFIKSFSQRLILFFIKLISPPIDKKNIDTAFRAVSNYGFANRTLITYEIDRGLEEIFARAVSTKLLYDAPHVYFDEEMHFGRKVTIHRNGANRALGPSKMASHALFSQTGEPVLVSPFASEIAYIGVGTDQNEETFFSANHEIGKAKELGIPKEKQKEYAEKIVKEMEKNKIIKLVAKLEPIEILTY
ncbi:MAG TPA: RtcB family protein [Candidatus Moranbacteria bacterium]|nr:RtcB family protein [Candidatus Moranbacteria bacterium]